jgi:tight adherence protein B
MIPEAAHRKPITPLPAFAGIVPDHEAFGRGHDDVADRVNGWFDRLLLQSGLQVHPTVMLLLSLLSGLVAAGTVYVWHADPLAAAVTLIPAMLLPVVAATIARSRRRMLITKQLPATIDELARAAKTGRSLEQCLHLVASDTPAPLGAELRLCARKLQLGADVPDALRQLPERTGMINLNILVMALTVHHQTGGDLVSVLDRLSRTIRDRLQFLGRLRAATITARATAVVMLAVPPAIVTFFIVRDPDYLRNLLVSPWSRGLTFAAVVLEILGSFIVWKILRNSQKA